MVPSGNGIMAKPGTSTAGVAPKVPVSRALVALNSSGCCTIACQVTPLVVIIVVPLLRLSNSPAGVRFPGRSQVVMRPRLVGAGGLPRRLLVEARDELQGDPAQVDEV